MTLGALKYEMYCLNSKKIKNYEQKFNKRKLRSRQKLNILDIIL